MTGEERSSTHTVVTSSPRFAAVELGPGREVRRVVTLFATVQTTELFAVESGWATFAVAPASTVTALRD